MRIGEAAKVTWQDVDFEREANCVRGDELTGTKNWEVRRAPMIPEMKAYLSACGTKVQTASPQTP